MLSTAERERLWARVEGILLVMASPAGHGSDDAAVAATAPTNISLRPQVTVQFPIISSHQGYGNDRYFSSSIGDLYSEAASTLFRSQQGPQAMLVQAATFAHEVLAPNNTLALAMDLNFRRTPP